MGGLPRRRSHENRPRQQNHVKRARRNAELPRRRTDKNCRRYAHGTRCRQNQAKRARPRRGNQARRERRQRPGPKKPRVHGRGYGALGGRWAAGTAPRRRRAGREKARRCGKLSGPGMPNADAVAAMAPDQVAAAPAVPAIRAAPTIITIPLIAAPIPTGAIPAVVVPTIIVAVEGIVLNSLRGREASEGRKGASGIVGEACFGAIGERQ